MIKNVIFLFLLMILLCACCDTRIDPRDQDAEDPPNMYSLPRVVNWESSGESKAKITLTDFYALLNQGDYDQAANMYGGSYELLREYNPTLDAKDKAGLLKAGCEINGFMCLEVRNINLVGDKYQHEFIFEVEFANLDGSLFILGPCCGATEESMPPKSSFTVQIVCASDESCLVMELPPYVP